MEEIKISGEWNIENKKYKGDIYILKNKKMIRLLLQYIDVTNPFCDEVFPEKIDLIYGISFVNDIPITLLECTTIRKNSNLSSGKCEILIDCKFCIYGLKFKKIDDVTFNKVIIRFTNSLEWSGLNGFSSFLKDTTREKPISIKYEYKDKIIYKISENVKLEFIPILGKHKHEREIKSEKVIFEQFMTVNLTYQKVEKFTNILKDLKKVLQLIEMSTNLRIGISKIEGAKKSRFNKFPQIKRRELIRFRIYYSNEEKSDFNNTNLTIIDNKFICDLKGLVKVNGLRNWFEKYDDLKPIIELYNQKFNYDIGPEQEFLNVSQALEFYHTRFVVQNLEDFKKTKQEKYKNQPKLLEYIFDEDQGKADYIILKNRLIDLILNSNILYFFNKIINFIYFSYSVSDTRNYYTHYNISKKFKALQETELRITTVILNTLLEYYLLKELGFDEQYLETHTRNRLNRIKKVIVPYSEQKYIELYKRVNLVTSIKNISKNICKEYQLGKYIDEEIIDDKEQDLFFYLNTDRGKFKIRIFNERKSDEECNKIRENERKFLIYTRKHIYELIYFYEKYRMIIYKNKSIN